MNWLEIVRSYKESDTPLLDYLGIIILKHSFINTLNT